MSLLNYNDQGQGPALLLLHGFCESKEIWKQFEEKFSQKFRVISPDLPGFGTSYLQIGEPSIEFYSEAVYELLIQLKIDNCIMIGHSLGGYVALAFAEKHETMLNGLGMFHSTAFADSKEKKESRNKTISFVNKQGSALFASSFVAPLFFIKNRKKNEQEIKLMTDIVSRTSKESIVFATKAMRERKDHTEVLKNINVPVLFIVGKEDTAVTLEKSLEQCYLPKDSQVHFLTDTGHMGMYEREKETLKSLEGFLSYCSE